MNEGSYLPKNNANRKIIADTNRRRGIVSFCKIYIIHWIVLSEI